MDCLLFAIIICGIPVPSQSIGGLIWNKDQQLFQPIFNIRAFRILLDETITKRNQVMRHDFNGKIMRITSFEQANIFEFHDNNTKVSGTSGEAWNIISHLLNITLKPIHSHTKGIGTYLPDGTFTELLGIISRNETDIVPVVEMFSTRYRALKFALPMWRSRQRLYIRLVEKPDEVWVTRVFSWKIWCGILVVHFLLTVLGFMSQRIMSHTDISRSTFGEHYFYNFAMMCNQNYVPQNFIGRSRILETTLSIFSYLTYISFSTLLFTYMARTMFIPPFTSIRTMMSQTDYTMVIQEGSLAYRAVKRGGIDDFDEATKRNRILVMPTLEDVFRTTCSETNNYAMMLSDDVKMAQGTYFCRLNAVGKIYTPTWVAPGLRKDSGFKKVINSQIQKLHEFGIIKLLVNRWLESKNTEDKSAKEPKPIALTQVSLILTILITGLLIASIIFIGEKSIFIMKERKSKPL